MNIFSKKEKTGYTTTFNLGEKVYTLYNSQLISFKIDKIIISDEEEEYRGDYKNTGVYKTVEKLFRTKEELANSLIK